MPSVGFIGLGMMGEPMAQNLVRAGFDLIVNDVRPEAAENILALGAKAVPDPAGMAGCNPIFIIVQTGDQVRDVLSKLAAGLDSDSDHTVVVMSTITPRLIRDLADDFDSSGMTLMDAPVSGAPIVAQLGTLSIMVGGEPERFEFIKPYLEAMGQSIVHMGPLGQGLAMKLVNNLLGLANAYILPEALKIGIESGLDTAAMVKVMRASSGSNWLLENWPMYIGLLNLVANDVPLRDNFNLIAQKDIQAAVDWAGELGMDTTIVRAILTAVKAGDVVDADLFTHMQSAQVDQ
jgi:3-hydroxyisobutyrate dehydrogenase-like beta-hydroxyacid dehydrogenase